MAVGDVRNPFQLARPGNLLEEPVRVRDVRLDLEPLDLVEVSLADHQELQLVLGEQRTFDALEVDVRLAIDPVQLVEAALGRTVGSFALTIASRYRCSSSRDARCAASESLDRGVVRAAASVEEELDALALEAQIGGLHQILEAMANELEVGLVQLLLLHEHLLAHADLAEVVEQPGVAQFAQLLAGEARVAVRTLRRRDRPPRRGRRSASPRVPSDRRWSDRATRSP